VSNGREIFGYGSRACTENGNHAHEDEHERGFSVLFRVVMPMWIDGLWKTRLDGLHAIRSATNLRAVLRISSNDTILCRLRAARSPVA
jgi:preprotein translocase subunit SecA